MPRKVNKVVIDNPTTGDRRYFTSIAPQTGGEPTGWAVQCIDHLTEPYATRQGAERRMQLGVSAGTCPHRHEVVPVWETFEGRVGAPDPEREEDFRVLVGLPAADPAALRRLMSVRSG